jgi:o-succinylbenzoate synthase
MNLSAIPARTGPIEIARAELFRVSIPLREPFRISSGEVSRKDVLLVRISDDSAYGWGESSAMGGGFYSTETPDGCEAELLDVLLPAVLGRRFKSMEDLNENLSTLTSNCFARVAVETAAWEMVARSRGVSVRELLGISARAIPSGLAVGLYDSTPELLAAIERLRPEQYRRLKIKIKRGHDVGLVQAVREKYGTIPLFVDANADYTLADLPVFQELDRFGLMMFEQPFGKDDLDGSSELQRSVNTPVCMDESIETAALAQNAIAERSCRIVNLKIQRVGGFTESLRIIDVCVREGVPMWMGTMPELGVGSAQALALAAHPAFVLPTDVEPSDRWFEDDILTPVMSLSADGTLVSPEGPGWGFEVDPVKLEKWGTRKASL